MRTLLIPALFLTISCATTMTRKAGPSAAQVIHIDRAESSPLIAEHIGFAAETFTMKDHLTYRQSTGSAEFFLHWSLGSVKFGQRYDIMNRKRSYTYFGLGTSF